MDGQQALKAQQARRIRIGVITIVILAILTGIEYWISVSFTDTLVYLTIIALAKAGLILYYFMHISQLRYREGGH